MTAQIGFKVTPTKIQQILEAGRRQLSPEEFEELSSLLFDLEIYGLTPWINVQLGTLMAKIQWQLEIEPSPEWSKALQACDYAFLGAALRDMCRDAFLSPIGQKKQLCARLYNANVPDVVVIMEPYLKEISPERIRKEIEGYAQTVRLPQAERLYVEKVRKIKNRLEELHQTDPDEFYHRKKIIEQAVKEREKGYQKTMPELTLEELREILRFTNRLYR